MVRNNLNKDIFRVIPLKNVEIMRIRHYSSRTISLEWLVIIRTTHFERFKSYLHKNVLNMSYLKDFETFERDWMPRNMSSLC